MREIGHRAEKRCASERIDILPDISVLPNGGLEQQQGRRQRERHKFVYLMDKNNSFARPCTCVFHFCPFPHRRLQNNTDVEEPYLRFYEGLQHLKIDKLSFSPLN